MDIADRRELFVDYELIEKLEGARLKLHHPRPENVALRYDDPWATNGGYVTVIKDGDTYRMYYKGVSRPDADNADGQYTCYAESSDGIRWEKPELGLFEVEGTRKNNVVHFGNGPTSHNFSPFLDTKPGIPAAERFKAIAGTKETGLLTYHSQDGVHWTAYDRPPMQPATAPETRYDSQNVGFWSVHENRYCCYFRVFIDGIRTIARTTSPDFVTWTEPVLMSFGNTPMEHLYINQTHPYFRAPHIYVSLPARFMAGRKVLSDDEGAQFEIKHHRGVGYWQDCAEAVFMTSRGGNRYHRTFMEGFVRPGLDRRNWASRCNYPALGVVPTGEGEMSLYVGRHNQQPTTHLQRLSLRYDGFSSVNAPYSGGEVVTKPLSFAGSRLVLNYATGAGGHIDVEMLDADGRRIPGFGGADAARLIGDEIDRTVDWKSGSSVAKLSGEPVKLRFSLKDADIYSFRFTTEE